MQTGEGFTDPGGDYYSRLYPEWAKSRALERLRQLGFSVTFESSAAEARDIFASELLRRAAHGTACDTTGLQPGVNPNPSRAAIVDGAPATGTVI